jgi:hypothetical protein
MARCLGKRLLDLRVLRPLASALTRRHIPTPIGLIAFETLPEKEKADMFVALAAQLRWKGSTCAPSFTWYGVLGGAARRKGVRHGVFAVAACAATVGAPLEGPAPRQCSAKATEKAPETGSTLFHTRPTQVHASPHWSTYDPRRSTLVHPGSGLSILRGVTRSQSRGRNPQVENGREWGDLQLRRPLRAPPGR